LGGFSGGGFGVFVGGGGTGVSVGGGAGVGVKPADTGAGCQANNTRATTPKIKILGKIRCGICVYLLLAAMAGRWSPKNTWAKAG
jgi:hypothetical protein